MKKRIVLLIIMLYILLSGSIIVSSDSISYSYDSNNRLTVETRINGSNSTKIRYFYDSNGNLINKVMETTGPKTGNEVESFETIVQ